MFLADQHMHTSFSPDGSSSMSDMAEASCRMGLNSVCFTDHVEDCAQNPVCTVLFPPFESWDEMISMHGTLKDRYSGKLDICLGFELDTPHNMPETAKKLYEQPGFDLVIGSIHHVRGMDDFSALRYPSREWCRDLFRRYFLEYTELAKSGFYDIIGHIGYFLRYMAKLGKTYDLMEFEPLIRELFSVVISGGKGIEVNTSGLRSPYGDFIPDVRILRIYRDMGGEIITVGSDAHSASDCGAGVDTACEMLRSIGYKYAAVYKNHKPQFTKIN